MGIFAKIGTNFLMLWNEGVSLLKNSGRRQQCASACINFTVVGFLLGGRNQELALVHAARTGGGARSRKPYDDRHPLGQYRTQVLDTHGSFVSASDEGFPRNQPKTRCLRSNAFLASLRSFKTSL
jgi:hypothetical protein